MHTTEIQMPRSGRRRGRYSDEFKRQLVGACLEPGVSTAAVALANGLNANLLRRWVVESSAGCTPERLKLRPSIAPILADAAFIPVKFDPLPPPDQGDIRIELRSGTTSACIHWPLSASVQCAAWVKAVLQ